MKKLKQEKISFFNKYLSIWVLVCMGIGIVCGKFIPYFSEFLNKFSFYEVNIPICLLLWLMIIPMLLKIDFFSLKNILKKPKGMILTWSINWAVKPFTMYAIALLFFKVFYKNIIDHSLADDYICGLVLLGAAPCTAMVFVWNNLVKGSQSYTLVQVASNDIILLILFGPIIKLLLNINGAIVPWVNLIIMIVFFIIIPLLIAFCLRLIIIKTKGLDFLNNKIINKADNTSIVWLLLTLILLFSIQSEIIINNPIDICLIAIPILIQTFLIFTITYLLARLLKLPFNIAAPSSIIGTSNFFELAVAVAMFLFAKNPGVSLATVVGVLIEVPAMLLIVQICKKTKKWYEKNRVKMKIAFICTHNSCRSQMSEAIAKHKYKNHEFYSAGTHIKNEINPDAVTTIKKVYNIDMTKTQKPKLIEQLPKMDIIVTMGCGVQCPVVECKHFEDWQLQDPSNTNEEMFLETVKKIENKLDALISRIDNGEI